MRLGFFSFFSIVFLILSFSQTGSAATACGVNTPRRAMVRFPIVFRANDALMGAPLSRLEAWKLSGKSWRQVPLQIDEVDQDGSYVLEQGLTFTKYNDDGLLDGNDELSVLGASLGAEFKRKTVPQHVVNRFSRFQRVDFCGTDGAYLGSLLIGQTHELAFVPNYTALFSRDSGDVVTSKYHYSFRQDQPMLIGDVKIKTSQGEKDVFSGSSFVMPILPRLFFLPSFYFGESDFKSEIESWRSGPVRSIVAVGAKLRKFFSLIDLHLFSELVFYDDYFQIPTKIEFIFDPSKYLERGSGLAYILKYPEGVNWELSSNLEPLPWKGPLMLDPTHSAFERSSDGSFAVKGSSSLGSFIAAVRVDKKALKLAPPPYLASKNDFTSEQARKSWPWLEKYMGSLGVFIEISGVTRGSYDFALDVALSNQADDGFTDFHAVAAKWPDSLNY